MANCRICGKRLPLFFYDDTVCKECRIQLQKEFTEVESSVVNAREITDEQLEILSKQDRQDLLRLYNSLFDKFSKDKELYAIEMQILRRIQTRFGFTDEEVKFNERLKPYIYANAIKNNNLPSVQLENTEGIILKKGEIVHFVDGAILKEMKSVSLGYSGGSQGVSIRIVKGLYYRVGATRGHIMREERFVDTSRRIFILTNQRLLLVPKGIGNKSLSVSLNKILLYNCYENGLEVHNEGKDKGYFFSFLCSNSVEIAGMCLGYLLEQNKVS